jgi:vacuolar-type H+-ATPase subunit I/STV1
MVRMIMLLSVIIILFGVAAGASWYLQSQQTKDHDTPSAAEEKKKANPSAGAVKPSVGESAAPKPLIRATPSPDTERLSAMAASLQNQQELLKAREQQVAVREKQMDIIHEEIKKEQKRLDGIKKKIDEEMLALMEKIEYLEKRTATHGDERKSLDTQKRDIEQATLQVEGQEWVNIKAQSKMYDKMEPAVASAMLTSLVDDGKLDLAAKILVHVERRQIAAIFAEMYKNEPKLPGQIYERMIQIRPPTVAAPKN